MPMSFRGTSDTQLSGALVVDPAQGEPEPDRIFVLTEWTDLTRDQLKTIAAAPDPGVEFIRFAPKLAFMVNGLSWPATERLTYRAWREREVARHQPRHAAPSDAHARLLLRRRQRRRRVARHDVRSRSPAARRDATDAARRNPVADVEAGARRQLAVPLPHHAPRVSRSPAVGSSCQPRRSRAARSWNGYGRSRDGRHRRRHRRADSAGGIGRGAAEADAHDAA